MSGAAIARELLLAHAGTVALVPAARIVSGVVPQALALPCIGITSTSAVDRHTLAGPSTVKVTERVQLTVMATTLPAMREVLLQARRACRNKVGSAGGYSGITCHLNGQGAYFSNEAGLAIQTQDLLITFDESAT